MSIHLNGKTHDFIQENVPVKELESSSNLNGQKVVLAENTEKTDFLKKYIKDFSSQPPTNSKTFNANLIQVGLNEKTSNLSLLETVQNLEEWTTQEDFSGSILLAQKGNILFQKDYGVAATKKAQDRELVYRWASISKTVTAVAVLQLAEEGKIELDRPVTAYLDEYKDTEIYPGLADVTIRELLSHTSKAPDHPDYLEKIAEQKLSAISNVREQKKLKNPQALKQFMLKIEDEYFLNHQEPKEMVKNITSLPLKKEPYTYNNFAFTILGLLVERIGQSYKKYVQKNIFDRAGMKSAQIATSKENDSPTAEGFFIDEQHEHHLAPVDAPMVRFASGNINGSAMDLYYFDRALKNGTLLGRSMLHEMQKQHLGFDPSVMAPSLVAGKKMIAKGGAMAGVRTVYQYFPEEDLTIIILGNTDLNVYDKGELIARSLLINKEGGKWVQRSNQLLSERKFLVAKKYWELYVLNEKAEKNHSELKNFLGKPEEFDAAIDSKNFDKFLTLFDDINTDALFLINGGENLNAIPSLGIVTQKHRPITVEDLDDVKQFMKDTRFSGVVSLSDGKETYTIPSSQKIEKAPFSIHSISKVFNGIMAIQMIHEGIIDKECLDKPIEEQLEKKVLSALKPTVRDHVKKATLHQAMTHCGGFGDFTVNYENALNDALQHSRPMPSINKPEDLLQYADDKIILEEGEHYSNLGQLLVGFVLQYHGNKKLMEKITKAEKHIEYLKNKKQHTGNNGTGRQKRSSLDIQIQAHEDRLKELKSSYADYNEILRKTVIEPSQITRFSAQMPEDGIFNQIDRASQYVYGCQAGGFWTTAEDLQKFGQWIDIKCKKDSGFRQLIESYGQEFYSKDNQEILHAGTWTASSAFFSLFLNNGFTIAIVSNQDKFAADKLYGNIVDFMLTEEAVKEKV